METNFTRLRLAGMMKFEKTGSEKLGVILRNELGEAFNTMCSKNTSNEEFLEANRTYEKLSDDIIRNEKKIYFDAASGYLVKMKDNPENNNFLELVSKSIDEKDRIRAEAKVQYSLKKQRSLGRFELAREFYRTECESLKQIKGENPEEKEENIEAKIEQLQIKRGEVVDLPGEGSTDEINSKILYIERDIALYERLKHAKDICEAERNELNNIERICIHDKLLRLSAEHRKNVRKCSSMTSNVINFESGIDLDKLHEGLDAFKTVEESQETLDFYTNMLFVNL